MTTFKDVADVVSRDVWGFVPSRQVKPVHFANGLYRAVCGHTGAASMLRKAGAGIRSGKSRVSTEAFIADARDHFEEVDAADTVGRVRMLRSALDLVLHQDRAFFPNGAACSPSLTHHAQAHPDPSDQKTGEFFAELLGATEDGIAVEVLRRCLDTGTDNVYLLTAPLLQERDMGVVPEPSADMLNRVSNSPLLQSIGAAFAVAIEYESFLEKTAFLQRVVTLGSFALFLHLTNQTKVNPTEIAAGRVNPLPILLCASDPAAEVREASRANFALARQHVERAFEEGLARELANRGQDQLSYDEYLALAREWLPNLDQPGRNGSKDSKIWSRFSQDFNSFSLVAEHPAEAFQRAAVRAAFVAMGEYSGEDPEGFGASIGRMAGLVYPRQQGSGDKYYLPAPQFLDMLVVSLVRPNEEITVEEFWSRAERSFGVLCGARSNADSAQLAVRNIRQASPMHLAANARSMLGELIRMGHAREYADDIAMVRAGGHVE